MEIKRYYRFISEKYENWRNPDVLKGIVREDRKKFIKVLDFISIDSKSFSKMAMRSKPDDSPEDYFKYMHHLVLSKFKMNDLAELFSPDINRLMGEDYFQFIKNNHLDERCGDLDWYLYRLAKELGLDPVKKLPLGGGGWSENEKHAEEGEWMIRYSYGYHRTPYGKLFIESLGITANEFRKGAFMYCNDPQMEYGKYIMRDYISCLTTEEVASLPAVNQYGSVDESVSKKFVHYEEEDGRILLHIDEFLREQKAQQRVDVNRSVEKMKEIFDPENVEYVNGIIVVYID